MIHSLPASSPRPEKLNNPFSYEPHPLCILAAQEVQRQIEAEAVLHEDAEKGKMFGILVVENEQGEMGFLAAYSGLLAGRNDWPYFVPPVFDAQQPDGYFKVTERAISALNVKVREETDTQQLTLLKQQRKRMSEELQLWLFEQYKILNERGESKTLVEIWRDYHSSPKIQQKYPLPPGGTGDCCAPKLLQYAFLHHLKPLQIAEFWYGVSPKGEVRHHGQFYPACRGKCLPVLWFMIGATGDDGKEGCNEPYEQVYRDTDILVVVKPSGMLSVPGRTNLISLQERIERELGQEVLMPHRLDMDTSGLMVVALNIEAYHHLQQQFLIHTVYKRYVALLEGQPHCAPTGTIMLPLRPDPMDRPRQVVDRVKGKSAVTDYELLAPDAEGNVLVRLTPHTGRTHQLRVHCAHSEGLGQPIKGDSLYGRLHYHRLCLHAECLSFDHPVTGKRLRFEAPIVF